MVMVSQEQQTHKIKMKTTIFENGQKPGGLKKKSDTVCM